MEVSDAELMFAIDNILSPSMVRACALTTVSSTLYWVSLSRVETEDKRVYLVHVFDGILTQAFYFDPTRGSWMDKPITGKWKRDLWLSSPCARDFLYLCIHTVFFKDWQRHDNFLFSEDDCPPPEQWNIS